VIEDFAAAASLGFLLAFMVGPVFFVLLETSITKGFRAAVVFDLGVVLGDIVFILIAYFSSYRLIQSIKDEPALFIFGGLLMFTYGIISFIKVRRNSREIMDEPTLNVTKKGYLGLFLKGFLLNFINVGVLGFWLALLITIGPQLDMEAQRIFWFFSMILLSYFAVDIVKILIAKKLRNSLSPKNIRWMKLLISIILMVSGIFLMIQGWLSPSAELMQHF
jgi:threonine/homoserine/homoserine lactone efflux protein